MYTGLWWGNLREREHLVDLGTDGTKKLNLRKWDGGGMDWIDLPRIGAGGRLL